MEGVAYGLRDSLELLRELGVRPEVGRLAGGGARSELWARIVASVLDLPLERTATDAGSAFGAALLGGRSRTAPSPTRPTPSRGASASRARVEPDPAWVEAYARGYDRFRALYPALRPLEET